MANEVVGKQRRLGRRAEISVQRKDISETESSILRQLEKEDLKRFPVIKEEVLENDKQRKEQRRSSKVLHNGELNRETHGSEEKGRRRFGKKEVLRPKRGKIGRFLQKRVSNKINKRWHSDSELLDSMSKEEESAARMKSKAEDVKNAAMHGTNKRQNYQRPAECLLCNEVGTERIGVKLDTEGQFSMKKDDEIRNWMNCSFPSTMPYGKEIRAKERKREDLNSGDSRVINLLIEYFKDLNKEVREFREEKKKTREQIQQIEVKMEKLLAKLEAPEITRGTQKSKATMEAKEIREGGMLEEGSSMQERCTAQKAKQIFAITDDSKCVEIDNRQDIRQEIRNILADVHDKYHKQLVEHEMRMKCVQEKAEIDIQNLMKTIVGNYVELSYLRGTEKEITRMVNHRRDDLPDGDCNPRGCTMKKLANKQKDDEVTSGVVSSKREDLQQRNSDGTEKDRRTQGTALSRKLASEDLKKYKFYFPRNKGDERDVKNANEKDEKEPSKNPASSTTGGCKEEQTRETKDSKKARNGTDDAKGKEIVGFNSLMLRNQSPPEGLGASYLEWKKFWCEKLQKRNEILQEKRDKKVKAKNEKRNEGEEDEDGRGGNRNTT